MSGGRVVSEVPAEPRPVPGWLRRWWQTRRQRLVRLWGAGLLASLAVTAASALGYLERLQASALDLILVLGGQRFPRDVVIVAIDDAVFDALEQRQPIPRQHLAIQQACETGLLPVPLPRPVTLRREYGQKAPVHAAPECDETVGNREDVLPEGVTRPEPLEGGEIVVTPGNCVKRRRA